MNHYPTFTRHLFQNLLIISGILGTILGGCIWLFFVGDLLL